MDNQSKHRRTELGKDLAILLLVLLAGFLLYRAQLYPGNGTWRTSLLSALSGSAGGEDQTSSLPSGGPACPAAMAVMNSLGRYGVHYDDEALTYLYDETSILLSNALSSASAPHSLNASDWESALTGPRSCIYFDFQNAIPLSSLSFWMTGTENAALASAGTARRLIVFCKDEDTVLLCYENALNGGYYACDTSADLASLLCETVSGYTPNHAVFAFEEPEQYGALAADTLILPDSPLSPQVFQAEDPVPLTDFDALSALLQDLSFHTQAGAGDLLGDEWVLRESNDMIRVSAAGVVTCHMGGTESPRFPVPSSGQTPTWTECVNAAWALVQQSLGTRCGEARLCLLGTQENGDNNREFYFGYRLNGASVQFSSGKYAAVVEIKNRQITNLTLRLRKYSGTESRSVVLPERQAVAAMEALGEEGSELSLCYQDSWSNTVTAVWTAG
ncbi:MAG: hypothetical protein LKK00_09115 [Intestinimonas sp.]|jgi:hypothetical protein|nr:hypothetical protein [Intestinimonas sp.]